MHALINLLAVQRNNCAGIVALVLENHFKK